MARRMAAVGVLVAGLVIGVGGAATAAGALPVPTHRSAAVPSSVRDHIWHGRLPMRSDAVVAHAGAGAFTGASMESQPGDWIGQGNSYTFPTVTFTGLRGGYPTFHVTNGTDYYDMWFAAVAGSPLTPGFYPGAQRFDFRAAGSPGLEVFGDGHGCNRVAGAFSVDDATYAADGTPLTFSARFVDHCEGWTAADFGQLSYNSTAPFYGQSVDRTTLPIYTAGTLTGYDTLTVTNTGNGVLHPSGFQVTGSVGGSFRVLQDGCSAGVAPGHSCGIVVGFRPTWDRSPGTATLTYTDEVSPYFGTPQSGTDRVGTVALRGTSFDGFYVTDSVGDVANFGDAPYYGSIQGPLNQPIVGLAMTADDGGYWLVAADGGIFAYGDAPFYGSTGNIRLNQPIVGMAPTPDGLGYWMVAADGGIFAYGDAGFHGSTGSTRLSEPIVGIAPTPDGGGYWLSTADGTIFDFGDAPFLGSLGGQYGTDWNSIVPLFNF